MQEAIHKYAVGSTAVPTTNIRQVLDTLEYASQERVMFQMLVYTGCRISELDTMQWADLKDNTLYFRVGKNQKGYRSEELPHAYITELIEYRKTHRVTTRDMFGIKSQTFKRYFTRLREKLPQAWQEQAVTPKGNVWRKEYVLQLKGLRKTFSTYQYAREYAKWKDAGVAIDFTRQRMRHSKTGITAFHYVKNFDILELDPRSQPASYVQSLTKERQLRLCD